MDNENVDVSLEQTENVATPVKKSNKGKFAIGAIIIAGIAVAGTIFAQTLGNSTQADVLAIVNATTEKFDNEVELFETTHKNNLTSLFNENNNLVSVGVDFEGSEFFTMPKIVTDIHTEDGKFEANVLIDNLLNLDIKSDGDNSTLSLGSGNVYGVNNETLSTDLVKWLEENDMPLDQEIIDYINESLSIEEEDFDAITEGRGEVITKLLLKGKYTDLTDASVEGVTKYEIAFKDKDIKDALESLLDLMADGNTANRRTLASIMEIDAEYATNEDFSAYLNRGSFKESKVTLTALDGIINEVEIYLDDNIDKVTVTLNVNDTNNILNGFAFKVEGAGIDFDVYYEGQVFDEKALSGNIRFTDGSTSSEFNLDYEYAFTGVEEYDNGTLRVYGTYLGDVSLVSTVTSVNNEFYFDITLPDDYEMVLGKGKAYLTIDETSDDIVLDTATSNLFDNSIYDLMNNEAETLEKFMAFVEFFS